MKYFVALLVAFFAFALPAHAALVYDGWDTGPGGLSTPHPAVNPEVYAGLVEMNIGNTTVLTMSNDRNALSHSGDSWSMTIYTYDEVMTGNAPVRFTPAQYARAGLILDGYFNQNDLQFYPSLRAMAEANGNNALAQANTQVWDIMSSPSCNVNMFGNGCSGVDTFNWSQTMWVATPNGPGGDERLIIIPGQNIVLGSGTIGPVVPLPPAFWLLGSGLLGLVGVARRKK